MSALTLSEFLLARIADDEMQARRGVKIRTNPKNGRELPIRDYGTYAPSRVLAECEAKRTVIAYFEDYDAPVLNALAAVYSDHPDYDEDWRP